MLSEKMVKKLNEHIGLEFYSSNLYLQMSAWCSYKGFEGAAMFLEKHSREEMLHMNKLFKYVSETGEMPVIGKIKEAPSEFKSLKNIFEKILEHEIFITKAINALVDTALTTKDFSTFNFLQWYVAEQHEEEKIFRSILDKLAMFDDKSPFFVDKELARMAVSQ